MVSCILNQPNLAIPDTVFPIFWRPTFGAGDKIVAHQDLGENRIAYRECKLNSYPVQCHNRAEPCYEQAAVIRKGGDAPNSRKYFTNHTSDHPVRELHQVRQSLYRNESSRCKSPTNLIMVSWLFPSHLSRLVTDHMCKHEIYWTLNVSKSVHAMPRRLQL